MHFIWSADYDSQYWFTAVASFVCKTVLERWRGNSKRWRRVAARMGVEGRLAGGSKPSSWWKRWVISKHCTLLATRFALFMHSPTTVDGEYCVLGSSVWLSGVRPCVHCLWTLIAHDALSMYTVDGFQWNSTQIIVMWMGIAEKVFKVKGQRSRSWPGQLMYNGGGIQFDGVASRLTCYMNLFWRDFVAWWQNCWDIRLALRCCGFDLKLFHFMQQLCASSLCTYASVTQ